MNKIATVVIISVGLTVVFAGAMAYWNSSPIDLLNGMTPVQRDPCLFMKATSENAGDATVLDRQKRETFGFEKDLPLRTALTIFNAEQDCFPGSHEPLTEDEVIAAIAAGSDYGSSEAEVAHSTELAMIAKKGIMPKGALFIGAGDATYSDRFLPGEVFIRGKRIYLFLGLDKNPRMSNVLEEGQIFLVRKKFFKVGR